MSQNLQGADYIYHNLLIDILMHGKWKQNRTGTKTLSIFGPQVRFKFSNNNFPLITTKKIHWKSVVGELLWFISGSTNKFELKNKYGVSIWDEWGDNETGELGPIYGKQWTNWEYIEKIEQPTVQYGIKGNYDSVINKINYKEKTINQLKNVIDRLLENPDDRRLIVSAWNPPDISKMALPPCHWSYQFYSILNEKGIRELSIVMNIRSWDVFLGAPFNIASYALLLLMVAQCVNMAPYELIINGGDVHIYEDHIPYIKEQLLRNSTYKIPFVKLNADKKNIFDFTTKDIELLGYVAHPNWKGVPVAV